MSTITLPGLIDVHTHLRVPGGEHKEDFGTGTAAALAGGITMVLAMPNTSPAVTTPDVLDDVYAKIKEDARCDVGMFAGASRDDLDKLPAMGERAKALKIYLNDTFGKLRVDDVPTLAECFKLWPQDKMIAMHAEKQSVAVGIGLSATYDRPVHFCHISRKEEIELIADAKMRGLKVTCEVAPHHLFMGESDFERMGTLADMRPILGTPDDVSALWAHINDTIDCIATDHAPHTLEEKRSETPPPGVVGLETSLPLMLTAVRDNKLTLNRLIAMMHSHPRAIFTLPDQEETHVEVELGDFTIQNSDLKTKVGWTPFDGKQVAGRVVRVVLRGETVVENSEVLARPGIGQIIS